MSTDARADQSSTQGNLAATIHAELAALAEHSGPEWKREYARSDVRVALDLEIEGEVWRAYTQNVSPTGMSVICKSVAAPHSIVRVRRALSEEDWCEARVRHCTATFGAHKIGIEFERASETEHGHSSN